ncbi:hypothetical protein HDU82_003763 [Entophlyctis luteolus]|nr:hypothetical protein HDU82_003763 [Entophlyctis luteolus]
MTSCFDFDVVTEPQSSKERDSKTSLFAQASVRSLESFEAELDLKNSSSGEPLVERQIKFRKTVNAIQKIVEFKLYKNKSVSLEAYFKDVWKVVL